MSVSSRWENPSHKSGQQLNKHTSWLPFIYHRAYGPWTISILKENFTNNIQQTSIHNPNPWLQIHPLRFYLHLHSKCQPCSDWMTLSDPGQGQTWKIYHFVVSKLVIALLSLKSSFTSGQTDRVSCEWHCIVRPNHVNCPDTINSILAMGTGDTCISCLSLMDWGQSHLIRRSSYTKWIKFLLISICWSK